MTQRWTGVLLVEDIDTDDGRLIELGTTQWDETMLPFPLLTPSWLHPNGNSEELWPVGWIERVWREGHDICAEGTWLGEPLPAGTQLPVGGNVTLDNFAENLVISNGSVVLMQCRLVSANLNDRPCWPQAHITIEGDPE